jgi:hypothetical protein
MLWLIYRRPVLSAPFAARQLSYLYLFGFASSRVDKNQTNQVALLLGTMRNTCIKRKNQNPLACSCTDIRVQTDEPYTK